MNASTGKTRYRKNTRIFRQFSSEVSRRHVADAGKSRLTVQQNERGSLEWRVKVSDKDTVLLHSSRAPADEAQRQIRQWAQANDLENSCAIFAIGFAGMYHLAAISERLKPNDFFVIIEPDAALFKTAIHHCDLSKLATEGCKLLFVVGNTPDETLATIKQVCRDLSALDLLVYEHPASRRLNPELYESIRNTIVSEVRIECMNRCTNASFADEWVQHCLLNYPILLKHPGIDTVANMFEGKPAIIAGAGPSLDATLPVLRKVQDRFLVVAVGQAARSLINAGIDPDIIVAVDSDPKTFLQFRNLPDTNAWLVVGDNVFPPIIQQFGERIIGFSAALPAMRAWLDGLDAFPGRLQVGGTVAISAIDMAAAMGCEPLILTGIDLAFLEDGTTHAKKTQWETRREDPRTLVPVPGNRSETVLTSKQFAVYIDIMNTYLREDHRAKDRTVYNATSGGAKVESTHVIWPEEIEELALPESMDFKHAIQRLHDAWQPPDRDAVEAKYTELLDQLAEVRELALASEEICRRAQEGAVAAEDLELLEENDIEIKARKEAMLFLDCAILGACMNITDTNRNNEEDVHAMSNSQQLYRQMSGGADWLIGLAKPSLEGYLKE